MSRHTGDPVPDEEVLPVPECVRVRLIVALRSKREVNVEPEANSAGSGSARYAGVVVPVFVTSSMPPLPYCFACEPQGLYSSMKNAPRGRAC